MREIVIEADVKEFIRRLPDLTVEPPTAHLIMLAVRSRKAKALMGVKMKDVVVERKIIKDVQNINWRDRYFDKVYNTAVLQEHGRYAVNEHYTIPEIMGIYATVAPRSVMRATHETMNELVKSMFVKDDSTSRKLASQHTRFASKLHKYRQKGHNFITVDVDSGGEPVFREILDILSSYEIFMATRTSRGHHIVLDISTREAASAWYSRDRELPGTLLGIMRAYGSNVDILKESQEPIPGTLYCLHDGTQNYVEILE